MARLNVRDQENERAVSDDDNHGNRESTIFDNRDRDEIRNMMQNGIQNMSYNLYYR